jgi:phenylalanine-4-hydroxylase
MSTHKTNPELGFTVPDITARKNLGLELGSDYTLPQPYDRYTEQDHQVWKTLFQRQSALLPDRACDEFMQGLKTLQINEHQVPRFEELNRQLKDLTGWQIVAVHGLIPDATFFEHLANRRFPVTWWIREAHQLDYLQEPDVFHDLFGHVPLLANQSFADYLQAYGQGGLKANSQGALPMLARLYWYTVEFGLIKTPKGLRIYGAGIVSSQTESLFSLESSSPNRIEFDLFRIMRTHYQIDSFQTSYFVINSFKDLMNATAPDFSPYYEQLAGLATIAAATTQDFDTVLHYGDQLAIPNILSP